MTYLLSLPLWERGFKHTSRRALLPYDCRSPCGSVDLNLVRARKIAIDNSRSPCGSVDLNEEMAFRWKEGSGRSLCGSVDLNALHIFASMYFTTSLPLWERK